MLTEPPLPLCWGALCTTTPWSGGPWSPLCRKSGSGGRWNRLCARGDRGYFEIHNMAVLENKGQTRRRPKSEGKQSCSRDRAVTQHGESAISLQRLQCSEPDPGVCLAQAHAHLNLLTLHVVRQAPAWAVERRSP